MRLSGYLLMSKVTRLRWRPERDSYDRPAFAKRVALITGNPGKREHHEFPFERSCSEGGDAHGGAHKFREIALIWSRLKLASYPLENARSGGGSFKISQ